MEKEKRKRRGTETKRKPGSNVGEPVPLGGKLESSGIREKVMEK